MRRHAARPQAAEFGRAEMATWYRELDLLPGRIEQVIPAASSLEATVCQIMSETGLIGPAKDQREGRRSIAPMAGGTRLTRVPDGRPFQE